MRRVVAFSCILASALATSGIIDYQFVDQATNSCVGQESGKKFPLVVSNNCSAPFDGINSGQGWGLTQVPGASTGAYYIVENSSGLCWDTSVHSGKWGYVELKECQSSLSQAHQAGQIWRLASVEVDGQTHYLIKNSRKWWGSLLCLTRSTSGKKSIVLRLCGEEKAEAGESQEWKAWEMHEMGKIEDDSDDTMVSLNVATKEAKEIISKK